MENQTKQQEQEQFELGILLLKRERPLFEENYVNMGGRMDFLKWSECSDGTGSYQPDWTAIGEADIDEPDFDDQIQEHAEHVTGCLQAWLECAKSKAIPEGFYLMPIQPNLEMLKQAELEFQDLEIEDIQDRIVFAHQAMIQALTQSVQ